MRIATLAIFALVGASMVSARMNEVWSKEETEAAGLVHKGSYTISPLPQDYIATEDLPTNFTWCDHDGVNYCTKSLNQHIPQAANRLPPTQPQPPPHALARFEYGVFLLSTPGLCGVPRPRSSAR